MKHLLLPLLAALALPTAFNASHLNNYRFRKCLDFFKERNIAYVQVSDMDEVSISLSTNQTDDFDPAFKIKYFNRNLGFTEWQTFNNVKIIEDQNYYIDGRLTFKIDNNWWHGDKYHTFTWYDKNGNRWVTNSAVVDNSRRFKIKYT